MKSILPLTIVLFLFYSAGAQTKPNSPVNKNTVDTFSRNIIAVVKKFSAAAANPKIAALHLTKDFLGTDKDQAWFFTTPYNLAGSEKTFVKKTGTDRSKGIEKWEWIAVIVTAPKGTMTTLIQETKTRIDSILKSIAPLKEADPKHHIENIYAIDYVNKSYLANDSLSLNIEYTKPVRNTEKEALDSVVKIYRPMFRETGKVAYAANAFGNALKMEGIAKNEIQEQYTTIIKEVAAADINAAFTILMKCPEFIDYIKLKESLSPDQQQQVKGMASKIVNDIYEHQNKKNQPVIIKPVVEQPTITAQEKWCLDRIANAKYSPGTFFKPKSGGGDYAVVVSFDCGKGYLFTTFTSVPGTKTFFKTNENVGYNRIDHTWLPEDYITGRYTPTKNKYLVCSVCTGTGVIYKTQTRTKGGSWEQVNFNVFVHTPGRVTAEWEERQVCPQCLGAGLKKVE